ncbi:MAG: LytTR family DNA-binding domain-containing protein [Bacteroidota bacterium]
MSYKCLIVDDEELARELVATHLSILDDFELVASCANALEARTVLQKETIDLLFLDIEMPILKGTDFFKGLENKPKVIFTTAYRTYAVEGFNLNAVDYLLKPILLNRFLQGIDKFLASVQAESSMSKLFADHIFVKSNKKNVKILLKDVLYIESVKDYIRIHTPAQKWMVKGGITAFATQLDRRFLRVHRSFIVNMDQVTAFTKQDIEIGNLEVPIGESYKEEVLRKLR